MRDARKIGIAAHKPGAVNLTHGMSLQGRNGFIYIPLIRSGCKASTVAYIVWAPLGALWSSLSTPRWWTQASHMDLPLSRSLMSLAITRWDLEARADAR